MPSTRTQFSNPPTGRPPVHAEQQKTPNRVDLHVGMRIRMRRKMLGVSQEALADELGLTFQQVQKYERGANRVSASKLYDTARALSTTVAWFFEGLADTAGEGDVPTGPDPMLVMMGAPYGAQIAGDFGRLSNLDRSIVAGLVRRFADGAGDLPTAAVDVGLSGAEMAEPFLSLLQARNDVRAAESSDVNDPRRVA